MKPLKYNKEKGYFELKLKVAKSSNLAKNIAEKLGFKYVRLA